MGYRNDIDWEKIENEYRLNASTEVELAKKHGVSRQSIQNRAKKHGWQKDLTKTVELATKAALIEKAKLQATEIGTEIGKRLAEGQISGVEAAVTVRVMVLEKHQNAAAKVQSLLDSLADEVALLNGKPKELAQLILAVGQNDPAAAAEIQKMAALPTRTATVKNIVDALGKATEIERKAHGIKDEDAPEADVAKKSLEIRFVDTRQD